MPIPRKLFAPAVFGATSVGAGLLGAALVACSRVEVPAPDGSPSTGTNSGPTTRSALPPAITSVEPRLPPELADAPVPSASASAATSAAPPSVPSAWPGPWLTVTEPSAALYGEARFSKEKKLGYARSGGRIPVKPEVISKESCSGGWYAGADGGFICANGATLGTTDSRLKFAITPPNLEDVLPYRYARNAKNGTPLYKSIPSPDQIRQYEPYLTPAKTDEDKEEPTPTKDSENQQERPRENDSASPSEPTDEASRPWWQEADGGSNLHEVTLERMREEADGILEMRMMRGFYVAIDKAFRWNNRLWYKTTKGLVAPADRLGQVEGPKFKGVELSADQKLPLAWVPGVRKNSTLYSIEGDSAKPKQNVDPFLAVPLTGTTKEVGRTKYWETAEGLWIKDSHIRVAAAAEPPADLSEGERWVDINLTQQTLVVFHGRQAVYATMVSTGKTSKVKEKDHRTPVGSYRIREKHVTTTMDGDGTAAGDLPYSIEDVPYVLYFHRSYAIHGAFWHRNFGVQMSHGCVNLAPLDAKWLFFFLDPQLPRGWHGVWSSPDHPGSRVVIHE